MFIVIYTEEYNKDPLSTKIVYEAGTQEPMLFVDELDATQWADECLGGLPHQAINCDNFKKISERD